MENTRAVDQTSHRALDLIASNAALFARQGAVVASWRDYRGRKLGPYYRLAYREDGRQRSVYLGCCARLVERVRQALAAVQAPLRQSRVLRRLKTRAKAAFRAAKAELDRRLRPVGLFLKGMEIRGWRTSVFPPLPPISPPPAPPISSPGAGHNGPASAAAAKWKKPPTVDQKLACP